MSYRYLECWRMKKSFAGPKGKFLAVSDFSLLVAKASLFH